MNQNLTSVEDSYHIAAVPPVVIGGHGGSGTRVVAQILIEAGVYLGLDLNRELDNLIFTYIFKHPQIYGDTFGRLPADSKDWFALFEKLHHGGRPQDKAEWSAYLKRGRAHFTGPYRHKYDIKWVMSRWYRMMKAKPCQGLGLWGWKEPHTVFHLDAIKESYFDARYVLVVRHGLDMVYTRTLQQLKYWGRCFDLDPGDFSPANIFECWYRLNSYVLERGRELFGEHFMLLRFEDLCLDPCPAIDALLSFVQVPREQVPDSIYQIPRKPSSFGRYLDQDLSWIDESVKAKLAKFDYDLEG